MPGRNNNSNGTLSDQHNGPECKPLFEIATKEIYRKNAFRVTGLSVDATPREIGKQGDKLKLMQELGGGSFEASSLLPTLPTPTLDDLRNALQRIKNPENRLLDELFWFWPERGVQLSADPAIQALSRGDMDGAKNIWSAKDLTAQDGICAAHNLAILHHVLALDSEHSSPGQKRSRGHRAENDAHWSDALAYWQLLVDDDQFWEAVKIRIRQLNEPNLPTTFSRQIRSALPNALNKINAEVIVAHIANGQDDLARNHINLVKTHSDGVDAVEMAAAHALSPVTVRLREHIAKARQHVESQPSDAARTARELLLHAEGLLKTYAIFGPSGESRKDVFDDVADAVVTCAVSYQRKTDDNETFVALLERALALAISSEVRLRVTKNITIGKGNVNLTKLEPATNALGLIRESNVSPQDKLARIRKEIIPLLTECARENGADSEIAGQFADAIAVALRGISIAAHNDTSDYTTSLAAITLADEIARDSTLRKQIGEDHAQVLRNKQQREQNNASLKIRSDDVEVTHEKVRYNTLTLPAGDITGVRFGVFVQYTNGIKTSTSYSVAVASARHGVIEIECKRWLRSEDDAKSDFQKIVMALYQQIVPGLCERIAKQIASGGNVPLGEWLLTPKGVRGTTGMLLWKEEHLISWADVRFGSHQGQLNVSSATNKKANKSFSLREVWNAPIFKEVANAIVTQLNKR